LAGSKEIYNNIKFTYYTPIAVNSRTTSGSGSSSSSGSGSTGQAENLSRRVTFEQRDETWAANVARQETPTSTRLTVTSTPNNNYNNKMPELFEKNITRLGQCDKLCNGVQIVYLNRCKKSGELDCKTTQLETRRCNLECDLRVLASQGRCTPFAGDCGHGKLDIKVECIKIDKVNNLTRSVDLYYCDSNEIRSVNELYRNSNCYLPCENFDWKLADSKVSAPSLPTQLTLTND
jgi:hypothetical protein